MRQLGGHSERLFDAVAPRDEHIAYKIARWYNRYRISEAEAWR